MIYTYLIAEVDRPNVVKIGKSHNIKKRKMTLESKLKKKLEIIDFVDSDIEYDVHFKFRNLAIGNEWFLDDGSIKSFFADKAAMQDLIRKNNEALDGDRLIAKNLDVEIMICRDTGMVNMTNIISAYNKGRSRNRFNTSQWLKMQSTKEFIAECAEKYGHSHKITQGRDGKTFMHPALFIHCMSCLDVNFKVEISTKLMEKLDRLKHISEDPQDSLKRMTGALYVRHKNKRHFHTYMQEVIEKIKQACEIVDGKEPTEQQVILQIKMQESIALLAEVLKNPDEAVRIGILKSAKLI